MKKLLFPLLAPLSLFLAAAPAFAGVADNAVRQSINGIDVVALKTGVKDVVTIRGTFPAGDSRSPESNSALADLTAGMLDKGTTRHDKFAIAKLLGDAGATITFSTNAAALQVNAKCLRQDLPMVLGLLAEQLRSPAFAPEEFAKLQRQVVGQMRRNLEDPDFRAGTVFNNALYPLGHPNREANTDLFLADVQKATLDDVKAFYRQYYGPNGLRLVIVGDVDPAVVTAGITETFAGWTGGVAPLKTAKAGQVDAARDQNVFMADKASVAVYWGQATQLRYGDADALPLRLGTMVLGSGFTGRLMANVRDKEGLTYGIYSAVTSDTWADGDWRIGAQFAPELLEKGLASTQRQLAGWYQDGVTDTELKRVKGDLVGSYKIGLSTTGGMANTIINTLNRDLPLTFVDEFGGKVNAITAADVNRVIKQHLDPEKMVLVKAGTVPGAVQPAAK